MAIQINKTFILKHNINTILSHKNNGSDFSYK